MNTATATPAGTSGGTLPSAVSDTAQANVTYNAALSIAKTVRLDGSSGVFGESSSMAAPGAFEWQIVVSNTGNSTLTGITVADPVVSSCVRSAFDLAPGANLTYTCTSTGALANTMNTATATPAGTSGGTLPAAVSDTAEANVTYTPGLSIAKTVRLDGSSGVFGESSSMAAPGAFEWQIVVSNTGNSTLTGITVADPVVVMRA